MNKMLVGWPRGIALSPRETFGTIPCSVSDCKESAAGMLAPHAQVMCSTHILSANVDYVRTQSSAYAQSFVVHGVPLKDAPPQLAPVITSHKHAGQWFLPFCLPSAEAVLKEVGCGKKDKDDWLSWCEGASAVLVKGFGHAASIIHNDEKISTVVSNIMVDEVDGEVGQEALHTLWRLGGLQNVVPTFVFHSEGLPFPIVYLHRLGGTTLPSLWVCPDLGMWASSLQACVDMVMGRSKERRVGSSPRSCVIHAPTAVLDSPRTRAESDVSTSSTSSTSSASSASASLSPVAMTDWDIGVPAEHDTSFVTDGKAAADQFTAYVQKVVRASEIEGELPFAFEE